MTTLIKHRQIVQDDGWQTLADDAPLPASGDVLVSLPRWLAEHAALVSRTDGRSGVWLAPEDDVEVLAESGELPPLVAVHFPAFTDGRGLSAARLLRDRYGYRGELRATGDVIRDLIPDLVRCGFDAFALREDQDTQACLGALDDFSEAYQADALRDALFRRRATAGAAQ